MVVAPKMVRSTKPLSAGVGGRWHSRRSILSMPASTAERWPRFTNGCFAHAAVVSLTRCLKE